MTVLSKIAFYQNRRDEVPNQELARTLAGTNDIEGIREIANHLFDKNKNVNSDCLKVLYEIGYIAPELIAEYCEDFIKLLESKQNRIVWGGMIALSTIAGIKTDEIYRHFKLIIKIMNSGSIIALDNSVKVLATIAAKSEFYQQNLFPALLETLKTCRASDVPRLAEYTMICVNSRVKKPFVSLLEDRLPEMSSSQTSRLKKLLRSMEYSLS